MIDYFTSLTQPTISVLISITALWLLAAAAALWGSVKCRRLQQAQIAAQQEVQLANKHCALLENQLEQEQARAERFYQQLQNSLRDSARWESIATERERSFEQLKTSIDTQKTQLAQHFESLAARIFTDQGQKFSRTQEQSVKQLLAPMREQLQTFSQQVTSFQQTQIKSQASLSTELNHLKDLNHSISKEAHDLSRALKGDKKLTGMWGELQLEKSLQTAGLNQGIHYEKEKSFTNIEGKRLRPDFIVNLPDQKHLIIDSKVSLVAFEQAVSAEDKETEEQALQWHIKALRKHIDDLASKDYSSLLGYSSPQFVFMYIALEPAYIEALRLEPSIYDYALAKNIVLTSHTTLMPVLKTVANLWLKDRSQTQAFELAAKAGEIYEQVNTIAQRLQKLGRSLQTSANYYNDTVTAVAGRQGLYGKIERFGELSKVLNPLPDITEIHQDIDYERLENAEQPLQKALDETL